MWLFPLFFTGCNVEIQAQPTEAMVQQSSPGWLGVRFQETNAEETKRLGFQQPVLVLQQVVQNSPASVAGLQAGMVISHVDGERVGDKYGFISIIQARGAGEEIVVRVVSKDRTAEDIVVKLGSRPEKIDVQRDVLLGNPSLSFEYTDYSRKEKVTFSPSKGKVTLLDFWATWCGPCLISMPELKNLHEKYSHRGLEVIGITDESIAKMRPVAKRYALPYTLGSNPSYSAFQQYGVRSLPTAFLIDKNGIIREVFVGAGHTNSLEDKILSLLEE